MKIMGSLISLISCKKPENIGNLLIDVLNRCLTMI